MLETGAIGLHFDQYAAWPNDSVDEYGMCVFKQVSFIKEGKANEAPREEIGQPLRFDFTLGSCYKDPERVNLSIESIVQSSEGRWLTLSKLYGF